MSSSPSRRGPLILLAAVIVLDQVLKMVVARAVPVGATWALWPGVVSVTHVQNAGVAFSLLPQVPTVVPAFVVLTLLFFLFYNGARWTSVPHVPSALALLTGGALGNLIDRIRLGVVVDYIDIHVWPVFNLADMAVTAGAALLIVSLATRSERHTAVRG